MQILSEWIQIPSDYECISKADKSECEYFKSDAISGSELKTLLIMPKLILSQKYFVCK